MICLQPEIEYGSVMGMKRTKKYNTEVVNTVIGEDSSVKGTIHSQRSIRIDGIFEGELNSQGEIFIGVNSM